MTNTSRNQSQDEVNPRKTQPSAPDEHNGQKNLPFPAGKIGKSSQNRPKNGYDNSRYRYRVAPVSQVIYIRDPRRFLPDN